MQARDESAERRAWGHEIKLDGHRMAARIEGGKAKLLTRSGLDWTAKYPVTAAAFAKVKVKTAYLDGERCGVGPDGVTSFDAIPPPQKNSRRVIAWFRADETRRAFAVCLRSAPRRASHRSESGETEFRVRPTRRAPCRRRQ